jgi:hypothetical protein
LVETIGAAVKSPEGNVTDTEALEPVCEMFALPVATALG